MFVRAESGSPTAWFSRQLSRRVRKATLLLAGVIEDPELQRFYERLAISEAGHAHLYRAGTPLS